MAVSTTGRRIAELAGWIAGAGEECGCGVGQCAPPRCEKCPQKNQPSIIGAPFGGFLPVKARQCWGFVLTDRIAGHLKVVKGASHKCLSIPHGKQLWEWIFLEACTYICLNKCVKLRLTVSVSGRFFSFRSA